MATMLPNYDYDAENASLDQKRKIAEAMQQMSLQDPSQGLGPGVRLSPLAPVLKVLQAVIAARNIQTVDKERATLADRYARDGKEGVAALIEGMSKQPGEQPVLGDGVGPPDMLTPEMVRQQRQKAVVEAMGSNHPRVSQLGAAMLQNTMKGDEYAYHTVGGQLVRTPKNGQGPAVKVHDSEDQWGPLEVLGTDNSGKQIMGQRNKSNGTMRFAPAGTNVNVDTQDKASNALAKEMGLGAGKIVRESYEKVKDFPQRLMTLESAEKLISDGMQTGPLTDQTMLLMQLGEKFGLPADPKTANSQTYRGQLASSILEMVKPLRPVTNEERKFAEQASGGDLALSTQALRNLLMSAKAETMNSLFSHTRLMGRAEKEKVPMLSMYDVPFTQTMDPKQYKLDEARGFFSPIYPSAQAGPGTPQNPMSLDDYIKSKRK